MSPVDKKFLRLILLLLLILVSYFANKFGLVKYLNIGQVENVEQKNVEENLENVSKNLQIKDGEFLVSYVVDGDTVHVLDTNGKKEIVRFLAVDTMETDSKNTREKCLANTQEEFTKTNLLGKKIFLIEDKTQTVRDKYGRLLAYIATTSATTTYFFNDYLLETGNAKVYKATPPALKYAEYLEIQKNAQINKLGMWNMDLCK